MTGGGVLALLHPETKGVSNGIRMAGRKRVLSQARNERRHLDSRRMDLMDLKRMRRRRRQKEKTHEETIGAARVQLDQRKDLFGMGGLHNSIRDVYSAHKNTELSPRRPVSSDHATLFADAKPAAAGRLEVDHEQATRRHEQIDRHLATPFR